MMMTDQELKNLLLLSEQLCESVRKYKSISEISLDIFYGNNDLANDLANAIDGYHTYPRTYSSHLLWLAFSSIFIFKDVDGNMLRMLDKLCDIIPLFTHKRTPQEFKEFKKQWNNIVCKIKNLLATRETEDQDILAIKRTYLNLELIDTPYSTKQHCISNKEVQLRAVKLRHKISSKVHQEGEMMETGDITSKTVFYKCVDDHSNMVWSFETKDELLVFLKSSIDGMKRADLCILYPPHGRMPSINTRLSIENIKIGYNLYLPHAKGTYCLDSWKSYGIWRLLLTVENFPQNSFLFPYIGIAMMEYMLYVYKKIDELLDTMYSVGKPKRISCDCGTHTYFICKVVGGIECMNCNKHLCAICNLEHNADHQCPMDLNLIEYQQNGGKICPACHIPTERDGGCFHITCRSCATHWCWLCGDEYQPGIPRDVHHNGNYFGVSCRGLEARNGNIRQEITPVEQVIAMGIPAEEVHAGLEMERQRLLNAQRPPFDPNI